MENNNHSYHSLKFDAKIQKKIIMIYQNSNLSRNVSFFFLHVQLNTYITMQGKQYKDWTFSNHNSLVYIHVRKKYTTPRRQSGKNNLVEINIVFYTRQMTRLTRILRKKNKNESSTQLFVIIFSRLFNMLI